MEFLSSKIQTNTQFFSKTTHFSPTYSLRKPRNTNPLNPNTKFPLYPSFPLKFPRKFQVSAHFGRPTSRRNYLRIKLTQQLTQQHQKQQQVSEIPTVNSQRSNPKNIPVDNFDNDSISGSQSSFLDSLADLGGNNTIFGADSQFWGTGTGPIFTVFMNDDGKVERVDVNEDEILARSPLNPLLHEVGDGGQYFEEFKLKMDRARFLAREMENGNNVLTENNSSVIKFVKSSGELNFVNMIMGLNLKQPGLFPKLSIAGGTILCGIFLVLVFKRFFTAKRGKEGYTRLEKEMLRRKIKARMEKDKLVKGSVEVIQDSKEPEIMFSERPQLDKQDLLNALVKVKGENGSQPSELLSDTQSSDSMDFASKIEEIRGMARHAREVEKADSLRGDIGDMEDSQTGVVFSNGNEFVEIKSTLVHDVVAGDTDMPQLHKHDLMDTSDDLASKVTSDTLCRKFIGCDEMEEIGAMASDARKMDRTCGLAGDFDDVESEKTVTGFSNEKEVIQMKSISLDDLLANDTERPQLMNTNNSLTTEVPSEIPSSKSIVYDSEIKEIGATDSNAPDMKRMGSLAGDIGDEKNEQSVTDYSNEKRVSEINSRSLDDPLAYDTERPQLMSTKDDFISKVSSDTRDSESIDFGSEIEEIGAMASNAQESESTDCSAGDISDKDEQKTVNGFSNAKKVTQLKYTSLDDPRGDNARTSGETPYSKPNESEDRSDRAKRRIIKSVKEAREYLSQKRDKQNQVTEVGTFQEVDSGAKIHSKGGNRGETSEKLGKSWSSECTNTTNASIDNILKRGKVLGDSKKGTTPTKSDKHVDVAKNCGATNHENCDENVRDAEAGKKEKWIEKNFGEFEPIVKKIAAGFQENYMVAQEKVKGNVNSVSEMLQPEMSDDDIEFEWMKDDRLREIVFKVRENELMGRDPFHLMDGEDKRMFFEGLEKKVEKVNKKLAGLHQWIHSNVENLNYGADGISVHDPQEKIIPRWKGPPPETTPVIPNDFVDQRKALFSGNLNNSDLVKRDGLDSVQNQESPSNDNTAAIGGVNALSEKFHGQDLKRSKTIIEGSDGSVRAGKKSGKEFWQHTKKWSRGFLECYNAETDPETKATMKDIGKDLDRWITEKEIQDAADAMKKVPEKGQKFIQEKLEKVKREMELWGPHAVVSKYSEYTEEKEVDYLWWLDLPLVACIELYTDEDGDKRIGFYSLEMGADLELEPKPYHVIAFEDVNDCKNLCYIIQAHMEMLGNGNAFVIPQQPKDAYREAKANGFNVTVIRKGELKLNVDQTLEEVEELITEIGSKMYHDRITRGRSVDIDSLMKGVFGIEKPNGRKRPKRRLRKPKK